MSLAAQERGALSALLSRTADNSAFYTALTAADGVSEINELAGLRADPRYRLVRVDRRLGPGKNEFEIALVDDIEMSVAFTTRLRSCMSQESVADSLRATQSGDRRVTVIP